MDIFKYMMRILYTRVNQEWQDSNITYRQWVSTLVMDELYYTATLIVMSLVSFGVGLVIGIVITLV